jgi:RNA polymerase sigma-70 factor (ECF subfamily)
MGEAAEQVRDQLQAARAGSNEALGQALESCRQYLLLVAEKEFDPALRAKGGASDLVQETFLEAQRDFTQFRGSSEKELLGWLRRMLLNNLGNFARRYREADMRAVGREITLTGAGSSEDAYQQLGGATLSPSGHAIEREQAEELERALQRLPEDYRTVIHLRYREERPFEEIGRLMNRSPDAARKLWARAMEQFRQEWQKSR